MASTYPNTLDALSTAHVDNVQEIIHAQDIDDLADATNKIETELGTLPKGTYSNVKTRLDALERPVFNAQSGTSYTLVLTDATKIIRITNGAAITLTVPPNSSVAFTVGTQITIVQSGAGQITVAPGVGVTLSSRGAAFKTVGQYSYAALVKVATDSWELSGDITT